jgi:MFS family permease
LAVWGFPTSGLCLLATALLQKKYVGTPSHAGNAAALFFIFFFQWFYGFFIDPVQFAFAAEIFPTTIRAKGIGLAFFSYFVGALTYTESGATAFKNIGWRMYMIWFACNVVSTVVIYFVIPETKQMTLEEIGELFGDNVVLHMTADGNSIVEKDKIQDDYIPGGEKMGVQKLETAV